MFIIILFFGVSHYKIRASFYFILYSLFSSTLLLIAVYILYSNFSYSNFEFIKYFYINLLLLAFIIKLPLVPFHSWLLEAHAESSTLGSIILASGILKLGIYGIYRFLLIYIHIHAYIRILILVFAIISLFYIIFTIQRLTNLKQIIASSSIIHLSIGLIGLITLNNPYLFIGGILILIHHSLLSCFFFFLCGELKYLTNTLDITVIKSLFNWNKNYTNFLLYGLLINTSFPITFAFISELLFFSGLLLQNVFIMILILIIILLNTIYSFWIFNYLVYSDMYLIFNKIKIINIWHNTKRINYIPLFLLSLIFFFITLNCSILIAYL